MSRRRRAVLLLGLALVLGGLAASDVAQREAALDRRLGPSVPVVIARRALPAGARLRADRLALREMPARFAPPEVFHAATALAGLRAASQLPAGTVLSVADVRDPASEAPAGAPVRAGERVADIVARGSPELVVPGARVDVLVTRDGRGGGAGPGRTDLALQDVEVLAASPAGSGDGGSGADGTAGGSPRVEASLRVTLRQAIFLTAAQNFAREIRLLPRAPGDRGHTTASLGAG